ncbi:MAG: hypothetical protein LBR83_10520 [Clostridiales bacterium]|jgi:hypothetical protein|nr:hypothetical protein [Clostridiales bacterium]
MINDLVLIRERGFDALLKELGPSGTARFTRQFDNGSGNYTEEREELLKDVTLDEIVKSIKAQKGESSISARQK